MEKKAKHIYESIQYTHISYKHNNNIRHTIRKDNWYREYEVCKNVRDETGGLSEAEDRGVNVCFSIQCK